jgi:methylenetetrahydrofolate dehydrogenase (NADP+)/methenyltetrahydrofolate cyclohydrolase
LVHSSALACGQKPNIFKNPFFEALNSMILDGKKLADKILNNLKKEIKEKQLKLKLAVVLVSDSELSKTYINKKREAAELIGVDFELSKFPKDISQNELEEKIKGIKDAEGIVVQLPLPGNVDTDKVLNSIPKEKDVEGFVSDLSSPLVLAIEELLKEYNVSLENKKIVVIGRGRLVGMPVAKWLKGKGLSFKTIDESEKDLSSATKKADVIITGTGSPNLIKENMVKEGVVIIDAGTCRVEGRTVGDVDFENVCNKAKCITPCIGGVGPLTIAFLFQNLLKCAEGGT